MQLISDPKPKTKTIPKEMTREQALEASSSVSTSSTTTNNSAKSVASEISISTGKTSTDMIEVVPPPPLEECLLTPISPSENPFVLPYFADKRNSYELPSIPDDTIPDDEDERHPTPAPISPRFYRPPSPKSRNTSRSRGPTLTDSPHVGLSDEVGTSQDQVQQNLDQGEPRSPSQLQNRVISRATSRRTSRGPAMTDSPLVGLPEDVRITREEARQILERVRPKSPPPPSLNQAPSPVRASSPNQASSPNRALNESSAPIQAAMISPGPSSAPSALQRTNIMEEGDRPTRADLIYKRHENSTSLHPQGHQEYSFTRNELGPRSLHILPRPRSTVW